jgi:hypothetical protein
VESFRKRILQRAQPHERPFTIGVTLQLRRLTCTNAPTFGAIRPP